MKKKKKPPKLYKHSYGHFWNYTEATYFKDNLQKKFPNLNIHLVEEKRQKSSWKTWCVCKYVPQKKDKK